MFHFTQQERAVLTTLAVIVMSGTSLQWAFKKYPQLKNSVNLIESQNIYPKVDINSATAEQLIRLPYIGEYTAKEIVQHRNHHGPFSSIAELKSVKGIKQKNFDKFINYLKISSNHE